MTKSFGFEQKEKARNSSIFLPFVKNNSDSLNTMSATVSTSADPSVEPAVESKNEPAVFSVAASSTVPVVIPVAATASEPVDIPVPVSAVVPAVVPADVPAAVSAVVPAAVPAAISAVFPAVVPAAATSTVPVEYIELVDFYVSTISRETSDTEKSGSLSVASIESIVDNNSKTATSSDAVSKNPRYAAHKRKVFSDDSTHGRSVPAVQGTSASSARTLTPDPRTASLPSSSGIPSFCATKKKKKAKISTKLKLDISRYPAGWNPRISNSSASSSSAIMPTAPPAQRNQHNLSAAIACSSFTPYEYSKKVKALELLTGKRDLSVNPFCKVVVTGIIPQPIRMVKKALIELTIRVEMVGKISFVGNTTEFLVLKAYKDKFCFKIGSNPFITIIYS
ncbi:hypothetical protein AYI69_g10134 [Smittium culicis]|uniref:Uncharacterized protein n=1 Tax=Smittium culicis TaxID=133412 RepID=A0A1R1X7W9_9FUNG|nr:hypothetical protein AYI69_g10134 [Smittium culicis]